MMADLDGDLADNGTISQGKYGNWGFLTNYHKAATIVTALDGSVKIADPNNRSNRVRCDLKCFKVSGSAKVSKQFDNTWVDNETVAARFFLRCDIK